MRPLPVGTVLVRGLVLRWIARHRLRSALAVLAVALGVAAFLSSTAVTRSILATGAAATSRIAGGADLVVTGGDTGLPLEIVAEVRGVPGVAAAAPLATGWVRLGDGSGRRVLLVGVDPLAEAGMPRRAAARSGAAISDPAAFAAGFGALLARPLADEHGLAPLSVQGARGSRTLVPAGTFEPPGGGLGPAARSVVVSLAAARTVLGWGERVERVDVVLAPGASAESVAAALRERLGADDGAAVRVARPGDGDPASGDLLGVVDVGLRIGALVALLVGVFLVHHTIAVGVAERGREVGILRALGATRSQVVAVFCVEALALGVAGAALGAGLGLLIARTSLDVFASSISSAFFRGEAAPIELPGSYVVAGIASGAVVALVAAWRPAVRAAGAAPSDAIRRGPEDATVTRGITRTRAVVSAALFGAALLFAVVRFPSSGYVAALLLLAAFLAAAPIVLAAAARVAAPVLRRVGGVRGRLAASELTRHPRRAALPSATLAIGITLAVQNFGNAHSLSDSIMQWLEENIAGDLFVSSGTAAMTTTHTPLDAALADEILVLPDVATVSGVRLLRIPWRGTRVLLLGLDIAGYRPMARLTVSGEGARDELLTQVQAGDACMVSENFSTLHDVAVGDDVEFAAPEGPFRLRVVGLFPDYSWTRGTVLLERDVIVRRFRDVLVDEFSVKLRPDADADAAARAIEAAVGEGRELVVTSAAAYRRTARELVDDFFSLAHAQVAAALAVGFLAILNSLWISVLLRRREIGLLRAAGATRGQVVGSIVLQAAVMGTIGAALGLVGGLAIEWIAVRRILVEDTGWTPPVLVPWTAVGITLALAVVTSALAGIGPARTAARTPVRDAIGWE